MPHLARPWSLLVIVLLAGCAGPSQTEDDTTVADTSADVEADIDVDTSEDTRLDTSEPDTTPSVDTTDDTVGACGDGVVDEGEACDEGEGNSDLVADACRSDCTLARCGDGVIDAGEACDAGDALDALCDADCQLTCVGGCEAAPATTCDGDVAVVYGAGSCVDGACVFEETRDDCATRTARCVDGVGCDVGPFVPEPDELIITEIMSNPDAMPDTEGEWVELYNRSSVTLDLSSVALTDLGSDHFALGPIELAPGASLVVARTTEALGEPVDLVFDHFSLTNDADEVQLIRDDGVVIDVIRYDGSFPAQPGASMQLDINAYDFANNIGERWCVTTETFATGDHGTPGALNTGCRCEGYAAGVDGELVNCQEATVGHIVDADTFDIHSGTGTITVRLAGVNAPECHKSQTEVDGELRGYCSSDDEFYGLAAYQETVALLEGQSVRVTCDGAGIGGVCPVGVFGRQLVYLELADGTDFGAALVDAGGGFSYTNYPASRRATYCQRELQAREDGVGMWRGRTVEETLLMMSEDTQAWYEAHDALCEDAMARYAE